MYSSIIGYFIEFVFLHFLSKTGGMKIFSLYFSKNLLRVGNVLLEGGLHKIKIQVFAPLFIKIFFRNEAIFIHLIC